MTIANEILSHLKGASGPLCDDCLTAVLDLKYRQQAFSRCNNLERAGEVLRVRDSNCIRCGKSKICTIVPAAQRNRVPIAIPTIKPLSQLPVQRQQAVSDLRRPEVSKPWFWEGNVQRVLVGWLTGSGWTVTQTANTAAKSPGTDIIARQSNRELWVSVKGFPEGLKKTHPSTQARHWFSHAVFDLVRYRSERANVELAIGLPERGVTYGKLAARSLWAFQQLPAQLFWVSEQGAVRTQTF